MGNIFSSKNKRKSRVTEQDQAVLDMKKQRDALKVYQERIELSLEVEREVARKLLKDGKKDRAKLVLKKKRYQESLLERSTAQLDNLESLVQSIEFAQIEVKVVEGLQIGNEALKKLNAALDIQDIERILEETQEGINKQQEIDSLLSNILAPDDLEQVETELEKLLEEEQIADDKTHNKIELPEIPATALPEEDDDDQLVSEKKKEIITPPKKAKRESSQNQKVMLEAS